MKNIFTKQWVRASLIRCLKTMAQSAVGIISSSEVIASSIDWRVVISTVAIAGVSSILTSIAGLPEVEDNANIE